MLELFEQLLNGLGHLNFLSFLLELKCGKEGGLLPLDPLSELKSILPSSISLLTGTT